MEEIMRRYARKGAALLLAAVLMLGLIPAAGASEALGTELYRQTTQVAAGASVTSQAMWSATYSDFRRENYITYIPGRDVEPVVSYGTYITSRQSLAGMAKALESQGLRVVGGINGGFYEMKNGAPMGVVATGGRLQSARPEWYVLGFRADGTALIGKPQMDVRASWTTGEGTVRDLYINGFNKIRGNETCYLFSDAFAATTMNTVEGIDVILRPVQGETGLPMSGSVECVVEQVRSSTPDNSIPAGCFILSLNETGREADRAALSELAEGDAVTLRTTITEGWEDVTEAVSGLYGLVVDGQVGTDFPSDGAAPRTAVGQRADGSLIFYTIDGRQKGHSIGATYAQVAKRLIELGCVDAVALDGGGSTSLGATYPEESAFRTINKSSEGSARSVSTCLFLTTAMGPTGTLGGFRVSAGADLVLTGRSIPLSVSALDTVCRPMAWSGDLTWTASHGTVTPDGAGGWIYTAGEAETNFFDTVTVTGGGVTGSIDIKVVGLPGPVTVRDERTGAAVSALSLRPGSSVDLAASSVYYTLPVESGESDYAWTLEGVGTLDSAGRFVSGDSEGTGKISVTVGGRTVTIPVTVSGAPFVDIDGHWAGSFIDDLYRKGISTGSADKDGRLWFYPNRTITRGEMLTMVVRMLGEDTDRYASVELPFADAGQIAGWLVPYVKTAYALGILAGTRRGGALYADVGSAVTREAAMTMIGRTMEDTTEADLSVFSDGDRVSEWAAPYVRTLVGLGVVQGSSGMLRPGSSITRGEMAKIVSTVAGMRREAG